jgi:hypothetical protein
MTEPKHKNVYTALAAAQLEFGAVTKGSVNPAFKSRYADLSDVVEAVAPALSRHGIAFVHYVDSRDLGAGAEACMVTALVHGDSDTRMECPVPLIVGKRDMQGFKSATTYAKRIGLESVTGVAPEDDDGNAASAAPPPRREAAPPPPPAPPFDSVAVRDRIKAKIERAASLDELAHEWRFEAEDIARLKAEDQPKFLELNAAKEVAKARLAPAQEPVE